MSEGINIFLKLIRNNMETKNSPHFFRTFKTFTVIAGFNYSIITFDLLGRLRVLPS